MAFCSLHPSENKPNKDEENIYWERNVAGQPWKYLKKNMF